VKQQKGPYGPAVGLSPDSGRPEVATRGGGYRRMAARQKGRTSDRAWSATRGSERDPGSRDRIICI